MLALLWAASAAPVQAAPYELEITRYDASKVPVGILGVVGAPSLEDELTEVRQVLMADLRRSGVFHARDLELNVAQDPDQVLGPLRLRELSVRESVDVLLWVQVENVAGQATLLGKAYDGPRGKGIVTKKYSGKLEQLRSMVHRLVGELVFHYTGEYGITPTRIAFVSNLTGFKEVYVMDYDGYNPRRKNTDRTISVTPSLSPDGERLLYAAQKGENWVIYEMPVLGTTRTVSLNTPGLNIAPDWHPLGDGYAVTASPDGNREIYHMDSGRNLRRLTNHPAEDVEPVFSPDGRRIAFTSGRGGSPQVYVMGASGGRPRRITFGGPYNSEPDWSPKGGLIAYTCRDDGHFHICLISPDGGPPRQITNGPWDDEGPSFSPDGRKIAFSSNRGGQHDIYMMNTDGSEEERLTFNGADNTNPDWGGFTGR